MATSSLRVACLSPAFYRLSWSQSLAWRAVWREIAPLSPACTGGRKHLATDLAKHGKSLVLKRGRARGGPSSMGVRASCSSTHQETPTSDDPPEQRGRQMARERERSPAAQDVTMDTRPHPPTNEDAGSKLLLGVTDSELKAAEKGIMREMVGKGKVELVPIAILPSRHDHQPLQYSLGKGKMDHDALKKEIARKRQRVLTNENFVQDEFEFSSSVRSWAGATTVAAMTTGHAPHVAELVTYLALEVGVSKEDANHYLKSSPSLLGTCVEDMREKVCLLESLGFSRRQVAAILPRFPSSVDVDWCNLQKVYLVLSEDMKMSEKIVISLMKRHPFLFTLDSSNVRECLKKLQSFHLPAREIAKILNHAPLLAYVPLTEKSLATLREFLRQCQGSSCIPHILFQNVFNGGARVAVNEDTCLLTALLHSYEADPQQVAKKMPLFFEQNGEKLRDILNVLSGSPLYLDHSNIAYLLENLPALLCSIPDEKVLRKHLKQLCKLFVNPSIVRTKLEYCHGLVDPACKVKQKYLALISRGFSSDQACSVLTGMPSLLTQHLGDELLPRLKLLSDIPGTSPSYFTEFPRILTVPLELVQARLKFLSHQKPDLLVASKLEQILLSTHQKFAKMCGCDLKRYHKETGLEPNSRITKRGIRAKPKSSAITKSSSATDTKETPLTSPQTPRKLEESPPLLQRSPPHEEEAISQPSVVASHGTDISTEAHSLGVNTATASCDCTQAEEVPAREQDSNTLLSSPEDIPILGDIEKTGLSACSIEDPPVEEEDEGEECESEGVNLDRFIAKELEELMSKLSEASSVEYRLSRSNRVIYYEGEHLSQDLDLVQPRL